MPVNIIFATTGNDTTGTGLVGNPFKTPDRCSLMANPGDTIVGRGGTHLSGTTTDGWKSGTSSAPITVMPYEDETLILQPTAQTHGIWLPTGSSYITFQKGAGQLILDGNTKTGSSAVYLNSSHHIIFDGVTVRQWNFSGHQFAQSSDITFRNGLVHDIGFNNQDHGFYCGQSPRVLWENMHIYNVRANGIRIMSSANGHIPSVDCIVRWCRIHDCGLAAGSSGSAVLLGSGDNALVHHNLIYNCSRAGIEHDWGAAPLGNNARLYYNSIYNNPIGMSIQRGTGHIARNNLILGNGIPISDATSMTQSHNTTSGTPGTFWTNPASGDFTLRDNGNSAIQSGTPIAGITHDFNGFPLHLTTPSRGAYEPGSSVPSETVVHRRRFFVFSSPAMAGLR